MVNAPLLNYFHEDSGDVPKKFPGHERGSPAANSVPMRLPDSGRPAAFSRKFGKQRCRFPECVLYCPPEQNRTRKNVNPSN